MDVGNVIAFEEVVDIHLPVGLDVVVDPADQPLGRQAVRQNPLGNPPKDLGQRGRVRWFEAHEHEAFPDIDRDGHQPEVLLVEQLGPVELGHSAERTIQLIRPAVVLAGQRLDATGGFQGQWPAPMTAHVVKRAEDSVLVSDDQNRIVRHRGQEVGPRTLDHRDVANPLPCGREDRVAIDGVPAGVDVPGGWCRVGPLHRNDRQVGIGEVGERFRRQASVHRAKIGESDRAGYPIRKNR